MTVFLLGQIPDSLLGSLGGKARNLHLLKSAGFDVPAGFVVQSRTADLSELVKSIGGFPVAVRSSCSMEDMANASFAGLYETFLNVSSVSELEQKIDECLNSRDSQRVKDYLLTKHMEASTESLQMSVLVQKMIDPQIAGVLFTLNPINGFEEEFYLEFCEGVGERLVSGHVTPSSATYNIKRNKLTSHFVNTEKTTIDEKLLLTLVLESKKIQAYFGSPQDIEWAVDKSGKLHILQSRPITTFSFRTDVPEMTNADLKDGGISARVCSPLMFSAYRNALQFSMGDYFKKINLIKNPDEIQWIYNFYGRVYWNAGAVKEGLKLIPGFNEEAFDRDLGIQKDYGESGPQVTALSLASLIHSIPVLMGLNREFSACEIMVDQFRDQFVVRDEELKSAIRFLPKMDENAFKKWFLEVLHFQKLTEQNYFRTIYNNSNFQSEFKNELKKIKTYQSGDEIELMGHLEGVSHLDVQGDLAKLARKADFYGFDSDSYYKERESFLSFHYHHGPAELDLTVPRWGENKHWVDELVKAFTPTGNHSNQSYVETVNRLSGGLHFFARSKFTRNLMRSRNFLLIREEMRSYSTRAYYLLRLGVLEFGKRLQIPEALVFMLDLNEIKQLLTSDENKFFDLEDRYLHYQAYRKFDAPNDFGGAILQQIKMGTDLNGIGCSAGVITGRARVILDIHQTADLTKDDILVTRFTDPGWTPVLARVGGVITEVGGLLSHAAVIGREYGIPAILNVTGATKIIKNGAHIRMNGKTGEIEILEESP